LWPVTTNTLVTPCKASSSASLVGQFCDGGLGIRPQHLARLVRIAHDADGLFAERDKLLDHRPSGIAGCADNSNHCSTPHD
jgi:hypothetical protein